MECYIKSQAASVEFRFRTIHDFVGQQKWNTAHNVIRRKIGFANILIICDNIRIRQYDNRGTISDGRKFYTVILGEKAY